MQNSTSFFAMLVLGLFFLACSLASCNKSTTGSRRASNLATSTFIHNKPGSFDGSYPDKWPGFLTILDASFCDDGGKITTGTAGTIVCKAVVTSTQEKVAGYYRELLKENGCRVVEDSNESVIFFRVGNSAPHDPYFSIRVGANGFSIEKTRGVNPKDWVYYSIHVHPNKAPR